MDLATSLACQRREFHVIHAWNLSGESRIRGRAVITQGELDLLLQGIHAKREIRLGELLGHYSSLDLSPRVHLVKGRGGKAIPELAPTGRDRDLLMTGTVCRTGVVGFFIGNTAETLLAQVDCSVLSVKPEGFVTPVTLEDD